MHVTKSAGSRGKHDITGIDAIPAVDVRRNFAREEPCRASAVPSTLQARRQKTTNVAGPGRGGGAFSVFLAFVRSGPPQQASAICQHHS